MNQIAKEFKQARTTRKLPLRTIAGLYGVSATTANGWEHGNFLPDDSTLLRLIDSEHEWISDMAFRCLLMRYPNILRLLAAHSNGGSCDRTDASQPSPISTSPEGCA